MILTFGGIQWVYGAWRIPVTPLSVRRRWTPNIEGFIVAKNVSVDRSVPRQMNIIVLIDGDVGPVGKDIPIVLRIVSWGK